MWAVFALESSGSTWLTDLLEKAGANSGLKQPKIKSTMRGKNKKDVGSAFEIQHLSLPWGSYCQRVPRATQNILKVMAPSSCLAGINDTCARLGLQKPRAKRFFVNISSHIQWYAARGVEAVAIIIIRDKSVSRLSRKKHCNNSAALLVEEELGERIIREAVKKLPQQLPHGAVGPQPLGRFLLVSYESLMLLDQDYLDFLYKQLGLELDYRPNFKDGNEKYLKGKG